MIYSTRDHRSQARTALLLILLVLAGAVLRFYRLDRQSLWGDEFFGGVSGFGCPTLADFWGHLQLLGSSQPPLFPMLEYMWSKCVQSDSPVALRVLPILLGLPLIPLGYAIGARLFARRAGMVAAACITFSTMHIWNAQSVRPYSLMLLLGCVSIYALLRMVDGGGRRWWLLWLMVNVLGTLSQWFFVLLVGAEGLVLLINGAGVRRRAILWVGLHGILFLPVAGYLLSHPPPNVSFGVEIGPGKIIDTAVGETVTSYAPQFPLWMAESAPLPRGVLRTLHAALVHGLDVLFLLVLIWCAVTALREARSRKTAVTVLSICLVPVSVLTAASAVSDMPFLTERYVMYASVLRYALLGALLFSLKRRILQWSFGALLVLLFAYRLALFLPAPTRTDWLGVCDYLRQQVGRGDLVMADSYSGALSMIWHFDQAAQPVFCATSAPAACDVAVWHLAKEETDVAGPPKAVWVIHNLDWGGGPAAGLEENLRRNGLQFASHYFPGMGNVIVYHITCGHVCEPGPSPPPIGLPPPIPVSESLPELSEVARQTGLTSLEVQDRIRRLLDTEAAVWSEDPRDAVVLLLLQTGNLALAEYVARWRLRQLPGPDGEYFLGLVLAFQGKQDEGESLCRQALQTGSLFLKFMQPFTDRFFKRDYAGAYREADRLHGCGNFWGGKLREAVRRLVTPDAPRLPLGFLAVRGEDFDRIAPEFGAPPAVASRWPQANLTIAETLGNLGRDAEAVALAGDAARNQPPDSYAWTRLRDFERRRNSLGGK